MRRAEDDEAPLAGDHAGPKSNTGTAAGIEKSRAVRATARLYLAAGTYHIRVDVAERPDCTTLTVRARDHARLDSRKHGCSRNPGERRTYLLNPRSAEAFVEARSLLVAKLVGLARQLDQDSRPMKWCATSRLSMAFVAAAQYALGSVSDRALLQRLRRTTPRGTA